MSALGAASISDSEFARFMAEVYEMIGLPLGSKLPGGSKSPGARLGKELGVSQAAVSKWFNGRSRPAEATCRRLARKRGKPEDFWRDGFVPTQLEPDASRLREQCVDLGLDESLTNIFLTVARGGVGMKVANLPDPLKRAAIAAVHLLGFSIEQTSAEAAALYAECLSDRGAVIAEALKAPEWLQGLQERLSKKRPGSGTRPRVSLVSKSKP